MAATIEAVRAGAQPGDPLPPLQARPFIDRVTDTEMIITGRGPGRCVAVLLCHEDFPGACLAVGDGAADLHGNLIVQ